MSTLTQLRTFIKVHRCQKITKVAENLGISQPTVSTHIQTIESLVEHSLFPRQARGGEPNSFAHDLALQVSGHIDGVVWRKDVLKYLTLSFATHSMLAFSHLGSLYDDIL